MLQLSTGSKLSEVPYTNLAGKIEQYFSKFQETGVPAKVTLKWLGSLGFTSSNDRHIVKVLKALNFIDDSHVPTERWRRFKNKEEAPIVLAEGIQDAYSDLFATYEDAYRKDREAIFNFFSGKTGKAESTVNLMVNTFLNLCQLANFELRPREKERKIVTPREAVGIVTEKEIVPEVHINIQLHLPATNEPSVYDNLFKSLKKHLLSGKE